MSIESLLLSVIMKSASYRDGWHFSFLLMYLTGCRHEETQAKYWSVVSSELLLLSPSKHGKPRFFSRIDLGDELFFVILNGELDRFYVSRSTLSRAFLMLAYPYRISRGTDSTFLHVFRYAYVFRQVKQGFSEVAIKNKMGHNDIKSTLVYINKDLIISKL